MWAQLTKETPEGIVSLGVVLLEDDVLKTDVPANESRDEIEPLFEVGDSTFVCGVRGAARCGR